MQIAYSEHQLEAILELYATGFKAKPGDKIIKSDHFVDTTKGVVLYRIYVQQSGEDEVKPLIVLPDSK